MPHRLIRRRNVVSFAVDNGDCAALGQIIEQVLRARSGGLGNRDSVLEIAILVQTLQNARDGNHSVHINAHKISRGQMGIIPIFVYLDTAQSRAANEKTNNAYADCEHASFARHAIARRAGIFHAFHRRIGQIRGKRGRWKRWRIWLRRLFCARRLPRVRWLIRRRRLIRIRTRRLIRRRRLIRIRTRRLIR